MNVTVNATALGPQPTGLGVYTREVVRRLVADGQLEGATIFAGRTDGLAVDAHAQVVSWTSRHHGTLGHAERILWLQTGFRGAVAQAVPGLVYSTVPEGIINLPRGAMQIITVHDIIPVHYPALYPASVQYYRHVLPRLLAHAAAVICNSTCTRDDLVKWSGLKRLNTQVIAEGYDAATFRPDTADAAPPAVSGPYLLWVGDMRPYKNLQRVLEAFAAMRSPGLVLVVAGRLDPRYLPAVREAMAQLGIAGAVALAGYVPDADLAGLYRHATGLVFASLYEGFGLPPLEAMASGCPVIASRAASLPEVCGDAALYVDPTDVSSIAAGMRELVSHQSLQEELRSAGLARAQLFSWEQTARGIAAVLDRAAEQAGGRPA